jgi:excisionase family DNA binding protein
LQTAIFARRVAATLSRAVADTESIETGETIDTTLAPPLMTIAECAKVARVSRSSIWRRIQRGEIPAVRVGNTTGPIRVPTEEFLGWLYGSPLAEERPPVGKGDLEPWMEDREVHDAA